MVMPDDIPQKLDRYLRDLHLPTVREDYPDLVRRAQQESWSY